MSRRFFSFLASLALISFSIQAFADDWSKVESTLVTNKILGLTHGLGDSSSWGGQYGLQLRIYWAQSPFGRNLLVAKSIKLVNPSVGEKLRILGSSSNVIGMTKVGLANIGLRASSRNYFEKDSNLQLGAIRILKEQSLFLNTETGRVSLKDGSSVGIVDRQNVEGNFPMEITRPTEINLMTGLMRFLSEGDPHPWKDFYKDSLVRVIQPKMVAGILFGKGVFSTRRVKLMFKLKEEGQPYYTFDHAEYAYFERVGELIKGLGETPGVHIIGGENLVLNYDTGFVYAYSKPIAVWQNIRTDSEDGFHTLVPFEVDGISGSIKFHENETTCKGGLIVIQPNPGLLELHVKGT